uniref:ABC transporter permease n=1 Tax=Thaumasiovibrio subtropicus TaxID=1891207 RepID=UPI000B35C7EE|nr:ABC transporter permease [Thaumasiovibrio subtropicus]
MLIKLAWRNLWRNRLRTSIMLGAMIFGLVGVMLMVGFMQGMIHSMVNNAIAFQTSHVQLHHKAYVADPTMSDVLPDYQEVEAWLESDPRVLAWTPRLLANGMIASARSARGVRINGVDAHREAEVTPVHGRFVEGTWLPETGRNPILISQLLASRLKLRLGSKVVLTFSDVSGEVSGAAFRVAGLFTTPSSGFDESQVFVRRSDLFALTGLAGEEGQVAHEIAILLNDSEESRTFAIEHRERQEGTSLLIRDWQTIQPLLASLLSQTGVSMLVMVGIFIVAMMFGIINIMLMSVFERTREFGVLMAVGMQKHRIFSLIVLGTTFLGGLGVGLGLSVSALVSAYLANHGLPLGALAEGLGAFGADTTIYPHVTLADYRLVTFSVITAAAIAAIYPARLVLKQRPVDAMAEKH